MGPLHQAACIWGTRSVWTWSIRRYLHAYTIFRQFYDWRGDAPCTSSNWRGDTCRVDTVDLWTLTKRQFSTAKIRIWSRNGLTPADIKSFIELMLMSKCHSRKSFDLIRYWKYDSFETKLLALVSEGMHSGCIQTAHLLPPLHWGLYAERNQYASLKPV